MPGFKLLINCKGLFHVIYPTGRRQPTP